MKALLGKIFLFLISLSITLIVVEVGFRVFVSERKLAWSDRPKTFLLKEAALDKRNNVYPSPKPADIFRIVVVGDSFTFGQGVQADDAFTARLERILNYNKNGKTVDVINLGYCGYATGHELGLVKRAIRELQADLVILQMTLNDISEKGWRTQDSDYINPLLPYAKSLSFSKLAEFVLIRLNNYISLKRYNKFYLDSFQNPKLQKILKINLSRITNNLKQSKIPHFAIIFPYFTENIDKNYIYEPAHQKIQHLLSLSKFNFLDLKDAYMDIPSSRLMVMPGKDEHPNEIAHQIASENIYRYLVEQKLIPEQNIVKNTTNGRP